MELIRIGEGKLKIMLTLPDMEKYHLDCEELDCTSEDTREAFRHIFDDACAEVNFDTEGERLFIQLYTSRGGGCEIFVTKIQTPHTERANSDALTPPERALLERLTEKTEQTDTSNKQINSGKKDNRMSISTREKEAAPSVKTRLRPFIFAFDGIDPLISVCRRLAKMSERLESRAYIDQNNTAYLVLFLPSGGYYRIGDRYAFIAEYGKRIMSEGAEERLCEHADLICPENAVYLLSKC
ncbi:MAG: adaptor protein MecA [Ruminococcaceae bacterium]|nr:adaptor protein MecA [Oscillospiraceae bacterium]